MHASPALQPVSLPIPRPAALRLIADATARPRHAVWHCRAFYAARAARWMNPRRALDAAKRDLYHLLATDGSDQDGSDQWDAADRARAAAMSTGALS